MKKRIAPMHGPSDPVVYDPFDLVPTGATCQLHVSYMSVTCCMSVAYDPFDLAPGQAAGVVFARYDRGERVDGCRNAGQGSGLKTWGLARSEFGGPGVLVRVGCRIKSQAVRGGV